MIDLETLRLAGCHIRSTLPDSQKDSTGLDNTPERFAKAYAELFRGYGQNPQSFLTVFDDIPAVDQMVVLRNIHFVSVCEHHLLPFVGVAHVGYIPSPGRVVGISKIARVVDAFACRAQVQERLTQQIVGCLEEGLSPVGVICQIVASHLCITARGVKKEDAEMVTCAYKGVFSDQAARAEFFNHIKG